ncbi:hypothetical protein [endosymbiont GvMRE of Glomus versiforme]|uniref:hypothetical protein n=1 Tax=endosymbiont GvMRE of Glomus versiforme TaxID=2039283 RepID=UPI0011C39004|nr:hypothetical protein [endosymbiont GvMRE of Glomus versiforme]
MFSTFIKSPWNFILAPSFSISLNHSSFWYREKPLAQKYWEVLKIQMKIRVNIQIDAVAIIFSNKTPLASLSANQSIINPQIDCIISFFSLSFL